MFLEGLLNQQFRHLHPLSSFQRRHFSLSILQLLASCFPCPSPSPSTTPSPPVVVFPLAVTNLQASCLLEGLRDPYEANRNISLELLQELPTSKIRLTVCHDCAVSILINVVVGIGDLCHCEACDSLPLTCQPAQVCELCICVVSAEADDVP